MPLQSRVAAQERTEQISGGVRDFDLASKAKKIDAVDQSGEGAVDAIASIWDLEHRAANCCEQISGGVRDQAGREAPRATNVVRVGSAIFCISANSEAAIVTVTSRY